MKAPPDVEKAQVARLYGGSTACHIRHSQKLYARFMRACEAIAERTGMPVTEVLQQVSTEATRRGLVTPVPGKHI